MKRYALITTRDSREKIERYLPGNYRVIHVEPSRQFHHMQHGGDQKYDIVIAGRDNAGWTLDDYVLPRLASGLIFGTEIDLSNEVMKRIPDVPMFRHGQFVTDPDIGAIGVVTALDNEETEVEFVDWNGHLEKRVMWTSDLRPSTDDEVSYYWSYRGDNRPEGVPEDAKLIVVAHSEVAVHMKVAGTHMWVAPVGDRGAQLYDLTGRGFSFPILRSEAGLD